jgi:hypothetical protein
LEGRTKSSNHRSSVAVLLGIAAVLAVPAGIEIARRSPTIRLVDAAWAIPVGAALGLLGLIAVRSARARIERTLGRAGGAGRAKAARRLAVLAICLAITASISVGTYEVLLRFEK